MPDHSFSIFTSATFFSSLVLSRCRLRASGLWGGWLLWAVLG